MRMKRRRRNKEQKTLIKGDQGKEEKNMEEKENITNPCLMICNNEVNIKHSFDFTFDEAFDELMDEYKKIELKNKKLKSSNISLAKEKNKILMEKEELLKKKKVLVEEKKILLKSEKSLIQENDNLRKEIVALKPIFEKFTNDSQKFQLILDNQKANFDKAGIGFNPSKK